MPVMKKRERLWFTRIISYIVENWLLRGYHIARNPPKGRKKKAAAYPAAGK